MPAGTQVHTSKCSKKYAYVKWNQSKLKMVPYNYQGNLTTFASISKTKIQDFDFKEMEPDDHFALMPIDQLRRL